MSVITSLNRPKTAAANFLRKIEEGSRLLRGHFNFKPLPRDSNRPLTFWKPVAGDWIPESLTLYLPQKINDSHLEPI